MPLANPIIKKELIAALRSGKSFAILFAWVIVTGLLMFFKWPLPSDAAASGSVGASLFEWFVWSQFGLVVVFAPSFAAGAFAGEREQRSYSMLFTTLLSAPAVVVGKLVSSCGYLVLLVAGGIPVAAAVFLLGGVSAQTVVAAYCVLIAWTLLCATLSLLCSILCSRVYAALVLSYVAIAMFSGGLLGSGLYVLSHARRVAFLGLPVGAYSAGCVCPPMAPFCDSLKGAPPAWVVDVALLLLAWAVLLYSLIRRASLPLREPAFRRQKLVVDEKRLRERRTTWPFYLIDPLRKKKPIADHHNPVFAKDMRAELFGKGGTMIRLFYVSLLLFCAIDAMWMVLGYQANFYFPHVCIIISVLLVSPGLAAGSFAREFEQGNIAALRSTLLSPSRIVLGKVYATLTATAPMLAAAVCGGLLVSVADPRIISQPWRPVLTATLYFLVGNACGILAAACSKRTTGATIASYVLVSLLATGVVRFFWVTPLGAMMRLGRWHLYRFPTERLDSIEAWAVSAMCFFLLVLILYALACLILTRRLEKDD